MKVLARRSVLAASLAALAAVPGAPAASAAGWPDRPDEALGRLPAGNRRFVTARLLHPRRSRRRLRALAAGQHPFAVTVGCADSRVGARYDLDTGRATLTEA